MFVGTPAAAYKVPVMHRKYGTITKSATKIGTHEGVRAEVLWESVAFRPEVAFFRTRALIFDKNAAAHFDRVITPMIKKTAKIVIKKRYILSKLYDVEI